MYATQYIDPSRLTVVELCDFLEKAFYTEIKQLMQSLHDNIYLSPANESTDSPHELFSLLYMKLEDEVKQMIRNDELIIFPLIRNDKDVSPCPARKLPIEMIQNKHKKIMQLLEKIRQQTNNYLPKSGWSPQFVSCAADMFKLEQELHKAIYTKENELLIKANNMFNQPCSGNCNHND